MQMVKLALLKKFISVAISDFDVIKAKPKIIWLSANIGNRFISFREILK